MSKYLEISTPDMGVFIKALLDLGNKGANFEGESTFRRGNILFAKVMIPDDLEVDNNHMLTVINNNVNKAVINTKTASAGVKSSTEKKVPVNGKGNNSTKK